MPERMTENDKQVWEYKINDLIKIERILKGNLHRLFTVLMALSDTKVQVKTQRSFKEMDKNLDSMTPIKDCVDRQKRQSA